MSGRNIVKRQAVTEEKACRARQLRAAMTPAEKLLWARLRGGKFGFHFRRQQVIGGFIADFYCDLAGVVVKADGGIHQQRQEADAVRDEVIRAHNLLILRFTNAQILENMTAVLVDIGRTCRQRSIGETALPLGEGQRAEVRREPGFASGMGSSFP